MNLFKRFDWYELVLFGSMLVGVICVGLVGAGVIK